MGKRYARRFILLLIVTILLFTSGCKIKEQKEETSKDNKTIVIGLPNFPLTYFWLLSEELGYYEREGVEVEIKIYDNNTESKRALEDGEVDMIALAFIDLFREWKPDKPFVAVAAGDYSYGADAIVARENSGIEDINDLKGKKIAVEPNTISEFFLDFIITNRSNIKLKDIQKVNYTVDEAVRAFKNSEIDVITIFEPFTQEVLANGEAKIIYSSKNERGLITDVAIIDKNKLAENFEQYKKVFTAWFNTVDFYKHNMEEAVSLMAKMAGISPEEFNSFMDGLYIMDLRDNITAFSLGSGFESLYGNGRLIGDFYKDKGILEYIPDPEELIDDSIIKSLSTY